MVHMVDSRVSILRLDMMRLPLGILTGVGFIGAGAILRRGEFVRGVTTAATIWLATVVGLCSGGGQMGLGAVATGIALATLWIMKFVEGAVVTVRRGTIAVSFACDHTVSRIVGPDRATDTHPTLRMSARKHAASLQS